MHQIPALSPTPTGRSRISPREVPEAFFKKYCADPKPGTDGTRSGRLTRPQQIYARFSPFDRAGAKLSFFLGDPNERGAELIIEVQATSQGTLLVSHELCSESADAIQRTNFKSFCEDVLDDFIRDHVDYVRRGR